MEMKDVQKGKVKNKVPMRTTSIQISHHLDAWLKEHNIGMRLLIEKAALELGYDPLNAK